MKKRLNGGERYFHKIQQSPSFKWSSRQGKLSIAQYHRIFPLLILHCNWRKQKKREQWKKKKNQEKSLDKLTPSTKIGNKRWKNWAMFSSSTLIAAQIKTKKTKKGALLFRPPRATLGVEGGRGRLGQRLLVRGKTRLSGVELTAPLHSWQLWHRPIPLIAGLHVNLHFIQKLFSRQLGEKKWKDKKRRRRKQRADVMWWDKEILIVLERRRILHKTQTKSLLRSNTP